MILRKNNNCIIVTHSSCDSPAMLSGTCETFSAESSSACVISSEGYFDGINGAAVIYDPAQNCYQIYQQELALTRRSITSTCSFGEINNEDSIQNPVKAGLLLLVFD